jgi:hypothetical protein
VLVTTGIPPDVVANIAQKNDELAVVQAANVVSLPQSEVLASSKRAVAIANPNANLFPDARVVVQKARADNAATTGYFIYAYAAVQVFAKLADMAHGVSSNALADWARKESVPSILGPLKFDDSGDLENWRFALFSEGPEGNVQPLEFASVDICKSDQCDQLDYCKPCEKK